MRDLFFLKKKDGSLLVESIIAIQITLVGLLGVLGLLSNSLALNRDAGQKLMATYLAAEGVEVVKSLIDKNYVEEKPWNEGVNKGVYGVDYKSSALEQNQENFLNFKDGIYSYDEGGESTAFKRSVEIENMSRDEIRVVSTVHWVTKKGPQELQVEDHFFNWR